ncbi:TIGR03013 family XrtA/PEP-CTERM system glycosyltransferase [Vulgatibacter incomptus]|uniref:Capsular polysaccharide biosynthesis protein n=1 Tax=Vulgatibacter incomptus TaxID=1391653 RepID=A0A0K1PAX5_9BACT|nr:TIGR03013 family XrtA/PEP-CTERM system glycosyltransferase [Vulgatibacter incomptus]AKU90657.1 capsular polysaccharide biosynthesis protein [Vulgatibacter incomptus]
MARFLNHSYPGRKALLFCVEQAVILAMALLGAAAAAAAMTGSMAEAEVAGPLLGGRAMLDRVLGGAAIPFIAAVIARVGRAAPWALVTTACCAASFYAADLYDLRTAIADRAHGGRRIAVALLAAAAILGIASIRGGSEQRALALGAIGAAALSAIALRSVLPALVGRPRRVLVAGAGPAAARLARTMIDEAEDRLEILGFVPFAGERPDVSPERLVDAGDGLASAATRLRADWIVIAAADDRGAVPIRELVDARAAGIVCLGADAVLERLLQRIPVDALRPSFLAYSSGFRTTSLRRFAKRSLDVAGSLAGLLLAAPILAVAGIAIRLDSKGPVFYRQTRVGARGRTFELVKLRTMRLDAEAPGAPRWASEDDPRVTRVGWILRKARVDEIPQLVAVLRGEMSLVGPRPERPYFVRELEAKIPWYGLRTTVQPGITGWAQLRYPYGASVEDARRKLEYDLYYVKNGSLFLDLAIVFHTVRHVLTGRGAR